MEKVNFFIRMEAAMMDNGVKIRWKVLEYCIINLTKKPMKDNGLTINFKVKASSITKILSNCTKTLTMRILMRLMSIGNTMRVKYIVNIGDFNEDLKDGQGQLKFSNG